MKFLVTLCGLFAATYGAPIENDYLIPAAPPVVLVQQTPVVETRFIPQPPLVPAPLQFVQQPIVPQPIVPQPIVPQPIVRQTIVPQPIIAPAPIVPVSTVNTQFHAQDELGGVNFGYTNDLSSRQEIRTPDGVTRGAYSYVDANGIVQHVEYVADPINGFRVAATNLPVVDATAPIAVAGPVQVTAEVAAATAEHLRAVAEAQALAGDRKKRSTPGYEVPAAPIVTVVPAPVVEQVVPVPQRFVQHIVQAPVQVVQHVAPAPIAVPAPVVQRVIPQAVPVVAAPAPVSVVNTQFHAQDEFGGVNFGYQNENSARQEIRTPDGVTRGAYSYVDANGIVQHVEYVADPINGFRVAATNLPVVDATGPIAVAAAPVQVTPEVAAATADHLRAVAEAQAAAIAA